MRKVPRPFKMPWGKGIVVEEASISSRYHEPTVQLLEFDNGHKVIRFCSYNEGRFSRSPLMIDEKDIGRLGTALKKKKEIRKLLTTRQIPEALSKDLEGDSKPLLVCMAGKTSLMAAKVLATKGVMTDSLIGGITELPEGKTRQLSELIRQA